MVPEPRRAVAVTALLEVAAFGSIWPSWFAKESTRPAVRASGQYDRVDDHKHLSPGFPLRTDNLRFA